jgi:hypothetical protein
MRESLEDMTKRERLHDDARRRYDEAVRAGDLRKAWLACREMWRHCLGPSTTPEGQK